MSSSTTAPSTEPLAASAPPASETLRTLFMTLFLRGRSSRGLQKDQAPKSVAQKLRLTLLFYAAFGLLALPLVGQSVLLISVYLHAMTFVFLGMFIASSAGEVLFNREEADILLHRPIAPRMLLRAKIRVIVEVSLWLAIAFNLVGFFVGLGASDGNWRFPFAHLLSTLMMTMFCTGTVVLVYQLCLRWFGREWLDNMMTTAQVIVSIGAVVAGQVVPQLLFRMDGLEISLNDSWWPMLLPPAWFAAVDDVLSSSPGWRSIFGAALAVASTGLVLWLSYAKLSDSYQEGLQMLGEARSASPKRGRTRRFLERVVDAPPLKWLLRDSIVRSSFLLTIAYLVRDRDVKLRVYPGLAPFLIFPVIMLAQSLRREGSMGSGFMLAMVCGYAAVVPMTALDMLKFSQNWQAADVFRLVPLAGPARILRGARFAVLCLVAAPLIGVLAVCTAFSPGDASRWLMLIPSLMLLPVFAILPHALGKAVPFSLPCDETSASTRGFVMIGAMMASMGIAGLSAWSLQGGWFLYFLLAETVAVVGIYSLLAHRVNKAPWQSLE